VAVGLGARISAPDVLSGVRAAENITKTGHWERTRSKQKSRL